MSHERIKSELLIDLFKRAMAEEMGLVVECTNPKKISDYLHEAGTKDFPDIMVCVPSTPDTVMLVKKTVSLHTLEAPDAQ